jgi:acetylornithine deacetylase
MSNNREFLSAPSINKRTLMKNLQTLISIPSVNPSLVPGESGEKKIARYLYHYLKSLGLKVFRQKACPGRSNIIGILKGKGGGRSLLLNGHMDTVGLSGMEIDPLKAKHQGGRVYGRGSADMKSGIAAIISACETIRSAGIEPKGDVLVALVVDEEHKSIGTERFLDEFTADAAIVCEPTDLKIGIAHKGFIWGEVEISGKAAHGSRPEEGIDAIMKAGKLLVEIEHFARTVLQKKKHPLLGSPSLHASFIDGGRELSTYPDTCTIQLERRTIPGENHLVFEREMQKIIKQLHLKDRQFRATYKQLFHRPPFEISKKKKIVKILSRCYEHVLKSKSEYAGITWWMDSALFDQAGIPTLAFGPAGTGLHGPRESVDFMSVSQTASILVETIVDFCGI